MTDADKIEAINETVGDIKKTIDKIWLVLNGNGNPGLVTKVALNKQSINRLWKFGVLVFSAVLGPLIGFFFLSVRT